jgi:hypothetical protein
MTIMIHCHFAPLALVLITGQKRAKINEATPGGTRAKEVAKNE